MWYEREKWATFDEAKKILEVCETTLMKKIRNGDLVASMPPMTEGKCNWVILWDSIWDAVANRMNQE